MSRKLAEGAFKERPEWHRLKGLLLRMVMEAAAATANDSSS